VLIAHPTPVHHASSALVPLLLEVEKTKTSCLPEEIPMAARARFDIAAPTAFVSALLLAASACTVGGSSDGVDDDGDLTSGVGGSGGGAGGVCQSTNETDVSNCDEDCDVAVAGDAGVYECTVSCSLGTGDCGAGYVCAEQTDGTGACLEDCGADGVCSDTGDLCDPDLLVCLPGQAPTTDGTCETANVADPSTCDPDCDTYIEGAEGVYQCTLTCDPIAQDCGESIFYCQELEDGSAACVFDCSGENVCPGDDYYCDQDFLICVPDSVSG
jgi:hypothetical protein